MSYTLRRTNWRWRLLRKLPRRRHLKGTWLHRALGERILDRRLWKPEPQSVAGGLAIGLFFGLTPAYGLHLILALLVALFSRRNIPAAFLGCWAFNPLTAPFILPFEIWIGSEIATLVHPDLSESAASLAEITMRTAWHLGMGSIVLGLLTALLGYALVLVGYRWAGRLLAPAPSRPAHRESA